MRTDYSYDADYFQKTYSGWLGKIIGIRLGSPIEGWTFDQIKEKYGEIEDYLADYNDYAADDDSNGPLFFARALRDYPAKSITPREMGHTLLNYAPEYRGFFWWGGYGISTEHTAYENLKNGIEAPRSGSIEMNGAACAEQIGGQIFSDCWGFVNPGNIERAAKYAEMMSSVTHDGEGIYGGRFVAACISAAYVLDDIREVMEVGLEMIPMESTFAGLCRRVMDFYDKDSDKNWRDCFLFLKDNYGYDKYPGNCHIIPNAGVIFLSLLYGEGDFSRTQCICNMCGWDTDCNAGNVGAIIGVLKGIEGIENKWITPINDLLISSSVLGGLNIDSISATAQMFCSIGYDLAEKEIPALWKENYDSKDRLIHFDFEKSTGAIRTTPAEEGRTVSIENTDEITRAGHRTLKIHSSNLRGSSVRAWIKTYYKPEDLHDSRYDPSFTPIVFPGQTVKASFFNNSGYPVEVRIFAFDINNNKEYFSSPVKAKADWSRLEFTLPVVDGGLIKNLGIEIKSPENDEYGKDLNFYLEKISWSGGPDYNIDFSRESIEHFGYGNGTLHREISQMTYMSGLWELDGEFYSGSSSKIGESYTGSYTSRNYEYRCRVKPQSGEYHLLNVRVQGAARSYAFGFYGKDKLAFLKKNVTYSVLESCPFSYEINKEYDFRIRIQGNRFEMFIDDKPVMNSTDNQDSYEYGQIGFTVLNGSHCHYRDARLRPLEK